MEVGNRVTERGRHSLHTLPTFKNVSHATHLEHSHLKSSMQAMVHHKVLKYAGRHPTLPPMGSPALIKMLFNELEVRSCPPVP